MATAIIIAGVFVLGAGAFALAQWLSNRVDRTWQDYAQRQGGTYTPKSEGTLPSMALVRDNVAVRIAIYVDRQPSASGRLVPFNVVRATAAFPLGNGPECTLLNMPSLQAEPVLAGDDSDAVQSWLAAVHGLIRPREGLRITSTRDQIAVDLQRAGAGESAADFDLLAAVVSQLAATAPPLANAEARAAQSP